MTTSSIPIDTQNIILLFERQNMEQLKSMGGLEGFCREFETDPQSGLSKEEHESNYRTRKLRYGTNVLPDPPTKTWCQMFWEAFHNLTLEIMIVAGFITLILFIFFPSDEHNERWMDFLDPIGIFVAILIVVLVDTITNYAQQRNFIQINQLKNNFHVNVIRMGEETQISSSDILVGDILSLKNGDRVAADALYITGHTLKIDTSQETGESVAIEVNEERPFLLSGAAVESGDAHALVCAVGKNSQSGVNMMKIQEMNSQHELSPLEKKLEKLTILVTYIGLVGAGLTLVVLLIMWGVDVSKTKWQKSYVTSLIANIMVGITIFICAVPEGLPLAVTLSLGFSMKAMVSDNVFVRHLNACETMGGATTICSDKTGTLTQNKMTVVKYYMDGQVYEGTPELSSNVKELFCHSVAINSSAYLSPGEDGRPEQYVGSSSECALLQMIQNMGCDYKAIREDFPIAILHEFNSTRKRMSTIVSYHDAWRIYAKGAPDFMMARCSHYLNAAGERIEFTEDKRNEVIDQVISFADEALRTILVAYSDIDSFEMDPAWLDPDNVEHNLTMIGICGIIDPLRPEVPHAIELCKKAGVMVRMVTGDYINTAKAISRNCGILDDDGIAMTGLEFSSMSKLELLPLLPKLQVMARSSPRDKYRLVGLLMEAGEVVAVTGDGSNDSPALKRANVGLAMGLGGTELAKMASDIVILDDNFFSIVTALKWGRCVYDNVRGYLNYQLTVNFVAMFVAFIGSCAHKTSPLKSLQLLYTNIVIGSIGALALATQHPVDSLLDRLPYGENDNVISIYMLRNMIVIWVYEIFVLFMLLFGHKTVFGIEDTADHKKRVTLVFNTFILCALFNLINARVQGPTVKFWEGLFTNPFFIIIFFVLFALQVIIIQYCGKVFNVTKLNGKEWGICVGFGAGIIIVGILMRFIKLPDKSREKLQANRDIKKLQMENFYQHMTAAQMWDIENTPENINKVEDDI